MATPKEISPTNGNECYCNGCIGTPQPATCWHCSADNVTPCECARGVPTRICGAPGGWKRATDLGPKKQTTVAAFLSTVGSPQDDPFEGGGFLGFVNAVGKSRAIVTKQDTAGMCDCINKGTCENCSACKDSIGVSYPCFCWAVVYPIGAPAPDGFQVYTPPQYHCAPNEGEAIRRYNRKPLNTGLPRLEPAGRGYRERQL